jgi:two-component system sensor histidine kinase KdpD
MLAAGVWLLGGAALLLLDPRLDLANQALILVLVSAVASVWLSPWVSVFASALAVLAFNVALVPPRGTLAVDLHQHALLLVTMLGVSWIIALLMARQRRLAADARRHAVRAEQLRALGEALREVDDPGTRAAQLQEALSDIGGDSAALLWMEGEGAERSVGEIASDEQTGLRLCARENQPMGPGTGRHEEQPAWYLPLRGRRASCGAALIRLPEGVPPGTDARAHAQALCDQMGAALERADTLRMALRSREAAQAHALRNTLLAAVAHDHRTPLATIISAASSLHDQADRLAPEQRRRLAASIVDEAQQLSRLTDNMLQLARLDRPEADLHVDWESAEDIVGTVMRRARQRHADHRVRARVEPGMPLLRCDAVLLVQLLDNLVDNALKYGGEGPVELVARRIGTHCVLAVRDRGPGVPLSMRERVFEPFQRGSAAAGAEPSRARGAGVGLAVCRAIARVHGGELRLRSRAHGGSAFELWLPLQESPQFATQTPQAQT